MAVLLSIELDRTAQKLLKYFSPEYLYSQESILTFVLLSCSPLYGPSGNAWISHFCLLWKILFNAKRVMVSVFNGGWKFYCPFNYAHSHSEIMLVSLSPRSFVLCAPSFMF